MVNYEKRYLIITCIVAIIYNLLVFTIPYQHKSEPTFWLAWFSGMFAIIVQPIIAHFCLKGVKSIYWKIYSLKVIKVGYIYLLVQLIITISFIVIGNFLTIPIWILSVILVILIGLSVIFLILAQTYKDGIYHMKSERETNINFIDNLKVDVAMMAENISDSNIQRKLEKLAEEIQYSDPITSSALSEIEMRIEEKVSYLKEVISKQTTNNLNEDVDCLIALVNERNHRVKITKKEI